MWRQVLMMRRERGFVCALSDFVRDKRAKVFADNDVPRSGALDVQIRFQHLGDILEVVLRGCRSTW